MKKVLYFLAALIAFSVTSCKEDDVVFNNVDDLDRLPRPMFRKKHNTNISDESDQYGSRVIDGAYNAIQLHWYGVDGAAGYELLYRLGVGSGGTGAGDDASRYENWDPELHPEVKRVNLPAEQLHYELYNLEYGKVYSFAIRALHPTDPAKNSLWYGLGGGQEWEDYMQIETKARYATPYGIDTREKTYDGFKVLLDLTWDRSNYSTEDADTIESRFRIVNGELGVTHLTLTPHSSNPTAVVPAKYEMYPITDTDRANGYIELTGLTSSCLYSIALYDELNTKAHFESDKYYKARNYRTKGDPGAPIKFLHKVTTEVYEDPDSIWNVGERKYQACRIDTLIENFNGDPTLAEGQVFLLEGGKAYYIRSNQSINKGFTMKTDPADILAGKGRAKIYLGGIARKGDNPQCCNWNLGKQPAPTDLDAPIAIEKVIFQDIDFEVPEAINYGGNQNGQGGTSGNYFANMYSNGLGVEFESFELRNCTFQGMIRGFFRIQGPNKKVFNKLIIDNCVFFNQGYYDNNGSGYACIAGEGNNVEDNIFKGFEMTNCTIYDSPRRSLIFDNGKDVAWKSDVQWNVKIENNTFINFSTRSNGRYFFDMKFVPGGSKFSFKRNLIVLARDNNDKRNVYQNGCLIQTINGTGEIFIDVCDNYSAGCTDAHLVEDGIFSGSKFTANSKSFGAYADEKSLAPGLTINDLAIHVGGTPLLSTELFNDPNPRYHASEASVHHPDLHSIDPDQIWTRLQYKNDLKVTTHEIYTRNIGDQRWKQAEPKWFYPAGSAVPTPEEPAVPVE